MTLLELRTAARQRADMGTSLFISDAEFTSLINQSYFELYDLLIAAYGADYFATFGADTTLAGTADTTALPSDFYKLLGVDLKLSSGINSYVTLKPFQMAERNRYAAPNTIGLLGVLTLQYRLSANNLWFIPRPAAGTIVRILYVPRLTTLSGDSDTAEGISGWTEYIIVDAAIKALIKEESDVSALMMAKAGLIQRIEAMAANRDAGAPATVADSSGMGSDYFGGGYFR